MKKSLIGLSILSILVVVINLGFLIYFKVSPREKKEVSIEKTQEEKEVSVLQDDLDSMEDFNLDELDSIDKEMAELEKDLVSI